MTKQHCIGSGRECDSSRITFCVADSDIWWRMDGMKDLRARWVFTVGILYLLPLTGSPSGCRSPRRTRDTRPPVRRSDGGSSSCSRTPAASGWDRGKWRTHPTRWRDESRCTPADGRTDATCVYRVLAYILVEPRFTFTSITRYSRN